MKNQTTHDFSIRCTSAIRSSGAQKQRDTASVTHSLSSSTGESGLTGGTRVNVTSEKRITKKHKYIKSTALSPFLPGNKRLLN